MARRTPSQLNMLLAVDKPVGCTSHDVVSQCRRALHERRVGHAGTLDPMASGVMVVGVGQATRLLGMLTLDTKNYVADISFGAETNTDDAEGEAVRTVAVANELRDPAYARERLAAMLGPQMQVPPAFSAISVNGVRAYKSAREGNAVDLPPRPVEVYAADLIAVGGEGDTCVWTVAFSVSKGTYIRALARDLGKELGVGGYLTRLRRTRVGRFALPDDASGLIAPEAMLDTRTHTVTAHTDQKTFTNREGQTVTRSKCVLDTPEGLAGDERRNWLLDHALTMEQAARGAMPALDITPEEASELRFGRRIERTISEPTAAIVPQTHDVAAIIERANAHQAKPVTVFPLA